MKWAEGQHHVQNQVMRLGQMFFVGKNLQRKQKEDTKEGLPRTRLMAFSISDDADIHFKPFGYYENKLSY